MAWTIRRFFWVPHRFRYGILAAGGWGNYGDIRMCLPIISLLKANNFLYLATAIAMGVTVSAPFDGVNDQNLVIAYISTLILVFFVRSESPCFQALHNTAFLFEADERFEDHHVPSRRFSHRCQRLRGARCRIGETSREDAPSTAEDGYERSPLTQTSHAVLWTSR
jgi:hypothetical protein